MKRILILGAGQSSPALIRYLLEKSTEYDWKITVADMDLDVASLRINGHPNGTAVQFDANDHEHLEKLVIESDLVANLLAPQFQNNVVNACVTAGVHTVSASYQSPMVPHMHDAAVHKGIIVLNEMGLDPGLDHMSAVDIILKARARGGRIRSFCSYGSGVPAPDSIDNPFNYAITWNPRNVALAGRAGAQYLEDSEIKIVTGHRVFERTWAMEVDGLGRMEAYPNRDSLVYIDHFDLDYAHTMIRGTLRYPGFSETWLPIVKLGLPMDTLHVPNMDTMSWADLVEMFLPMHGKRENLRARAARQMGISPTGSTMDKLEWLGIFSDEPIGLKEGTPADALVDLLNRKLQLPENGRDMVVLLHHFEIEYPEEQRSERLISTFVYYGDRDGETAMSKSVGLPAAIAIKRILNGDLTLTGCHIPTNPEIYEPVMKELNDEFGIRFVERTEAI